MGRNIRRLACLPVAAAGLFFAMPAHSEDAATKGILAGFGISAASGKTTLGAGAGAIEAGLLDSQAFQDAGAIIAGVVAKANTSAAGKAARPVIVLAHDEKLDLVGPTVIEKRLAELEAVVTDACNLPPPKQPAAQGGLETRSFPFDLKADNTRFQGSDLVTALTTETAITGVALTAEDRLLINALLMNGQQPALATTGLPTTWQSPASHKLALSPLYRVPGEPIAYNAAVPVLAAYNKFLATVTTKRQTCVSTEGKAAIGVADAFANSLNAASDKGPAPLAAAIQLQAISSGTPLVLRLAIEQVGGTAITRSGLLYTFGWPGAATVNAGLKVSFRLIDPATAGMLAIGEIRCIGRQTNIKKVTDVVAGRRPGRSAMQDHPLGDTVCDYRVAT